MLLQVKPVDIVTGGNLGSRSVEEHALGLVQLQDAGAPVASLGQLGILRAVERLEVYLLPSVEVAGHVEAVLGENHIVYPVDPGLLALLVKGLLGSVYRRYLIENKVVLVAGHPRHHELVRLRAPERSAEVLVLVPVKIRPDGLAGGQVYHAYLHLGILVSGLGITGLVQGSVLALGVIDREHGHIGVIELVVGQTPAVRRPPESLVAGSPAEYLLVVHP